MTPLRLRFVRARTSALGAFALLALLAACAAEVPVPTEQGVTGRNGNPPSLDRTPGDAGISLAVVTTLPEMVPDTLSAVRVRLTEPDIEIVGSDTLVVRLTSAQEVIDNTM